MVKVYIVKVYIVKVPIVNCTIFCEIYVKNLNNKKYG